MRKPATADERERRMVEYLTTLHKGRLAEFQLSRLNRIANFRKRLMQLLDDMIEMRAEEMAAGMLMEFAPPRPKKKDDLEIVEGRLPLPPKRAEMPAWVRDSSGGTRSRITAKS